MIAYLIILCLGGFPQAGTSGTLTKFLFLFFKKNVLCLNNVSILTINYSICQAISFGFGLGFFFCAGCGIHNTTVQVTVIITVQSVGQEQLWLPIHISVFCELDKCVIASLKHRPQNHIWDPVLQEGSKRNALSWCFRLCQSVCIHTHPAS